jgi:hypothetical protein
MYEFIDIFNYELVLHRIDFEELDNYVSVLYDGDPLVDFDLCRCELLKLTSQRTCDTCELEAAADELERARTRRQVWTAAVKIRNLKLQNWAAVG